MRIVVAGGSGFLGTRLTESLRVEGHDIAVLTRTPRARDEVRWSAIPGDTSWWSALAGAGAVINLAGASIAGGRWTDARQAAIRDSRVQATRALAAGLAATGTRPVLLSGSAVGYYGLRDDETLTEETAPGTDFLAGVCGAWEQEALGAAAARTVLLRTGLVLARDAGALPRMALPFRLGAGGRLGSGRQYTSWIHVDDWIGMVRWALATATVSGPLNVTAPAPVTNAGFTAALARALHRPAILPAPAFALRLLLGEMADALLLGGQRVVPAKALALGYAFRYRTVDEALQQIYRPVA